MSIKTTLKDGTGTNKEAKVNESGPKDENSLWVHLSGITPEVTLPVFNAPIADGEIFDSFLLESGGSEQMAIDADPTAVDFRIESAIGKDIIISEMVFSGLDGSIKYSKWFSSNNPLTNGVELTFKSDNVLGSFPNIKTTTRLMSFSSGDIANINVTGESVVISFRKFNPPIILRATGAHGPAATDDDFIQVKIQDDIDFMEDFTCTVRGIKVPEGVF